MLCEECGKNQAVMKFYKNINGEKQTKYICQECASKMMGSFLTFGDNDPFAMGIMPGRSKIKERQCPSCGMTYSRFLKTGKLGCEDCYEAFGDRLDGIFKKLQAATYHREDAPVSGSRCRDDAEECKEAKHDTAESLRQRLNEAVKAENYEEAAVLKRKLDSMEKGA